MSDTEMKLARIFDEAAALCRDKNATYQDSWKTQGWRGNLSRILEKAGRLRAMLWRGGNTLLNGSKEHPRETALDMINTLAFMVINMDDGREWGHEETLRSPAGSHLDPEPHWQSSVTTTYQPGPEATQVNAVVGKLGIPGEEPPSPKPRKDRGSGPRQRQIVDAPQV